MVPLGRRIISEGHISTRSYTVVRPMPTPLALLCFETPWMTIDYFCVSSYKTMQYLVLLTPN
jgi:hypothetical protein